MRSKKGLVAAIVAAAVLGVLALGGVVWAQTASPGASGSNAQSSPPGNAGGAQGLIDNFLNQLAQNLNIDRSTLDNALKTTSKQQIDQAVAAGRLTQDQANQIKQRIDNGQAPFGFGFRGFGGFGRGEGQGFQGAAACGANLRDTVTSTLGISASDLQQARANGETISQIAQDHGKSLQDLQSAVTSSVRSCLDQQVQSGKLTQQQEQDILQRMQGRLGSVGANSQGNEHHRHRPGSSNGGSQ